MKSTASSTRKASPACSRADEEHRKVLGQPDHQPAHHGPDQRSRAAQDGGGEERKQQVEAHLRVDLRRQAEEDAGHGGETAGEEPGPAHHAFDLHAADLRQRRALGHGAHRHAGAAVGEVEVQRHHDHAGEPEDEDLVRQHADAGQNLDRDLQFAGVEVGAVAPDQHDQVPHHQRRAEGGEDHRQVVRARMAKAAEDEDVDEPGEPAREDAGDQHRRDQLPAEGEGPRRRARPGEGDDDQRQIAAPGHQLRMGEIGEAQNLQPERDADRAQRDDRARQDPVGDGLPQHQ